MNSTSKRPRRVFIAAGERSGDLIAADIARYLRELSHHNIEISSQTGPKTNEEGVPTTIDTTPYSVTGIPKMWKPGKSGWLKLAEDTIQNLCKRPPDVLVCVTNHGINLLLANRLKDYPKTRNVKTIMIGPPEIWGWDFNEGLVNFLGPLCGKLARFTKRSSWRRTYDASLLAQLYSTRGLSTLKSFDYLVFMFRMNRETYAQLTDPNDVLLNKKALMVPHPYIATCLRRNDLRQEGWNNFDRRQKRLRERLALRKKETVLGIFPGSRTSEIARNLPVFLEAALHVLESLPATRVVISVTDPLFFSDVKSKLLDAKKLSDKDDNDGLFDQIELVQDSGETLLSVCDCAMLSSGTLTLQATCLAVPGVVGYILPWLRVIRKLVQRKDLEGFHNRPAPFALASAILRKDVYREFVLEEFKPNPISEATIDILTNLERENAKIVAYQRELLGLDWNYSHEPPMKTVARRILEIAGNE